MPKQKLVTVGTQYTFTNYTVMQYSTKRIQKKIKARKG